MSSRLLPIIFLLFLGSRSVTVVVGREDWWRDISGRLLCEASYTCISSRGSSIIGSNEESAQIESIRDQFNRDGYVVLKDFFATTSSSRDNENDENNNHGQQKQSSPSSSSSPDLVALLGQDWYEFSKKFWTRIFQVLHERGHISEPNHVLNEEYVKGKLRQPGFKEIVHRNPGRYEISLFNIEDDHNTAHDAAATASNNITTTGGNNSNGRSLLLYHDMPPLQPIIDKVEPVILSILKQHPNYKEEIISDNNSNGTTAGRSTKKKKYNLLQSMLISAPDSRVQQFHVDTKHLNAEKHWPAHMINVFIPLINITTTDLGPTELVPHSHVETRFMYDPHKKHLAKSLNEMENPVTPLMNVGDALLFDFRVLHRGLPNYDYRNLNRPLLVLAFSIPSFHDTANWPGPSIFE